MVVLGAGFQKTYFKQSLILANLCRGKVLFTHMLSQSGGGWGYKNGQGGGRFYKKLQRANLTASFRHVLEF